MKTTRTVKNNNNTSNQQKIIFARAAHFFLISEKNNNNFARANFKRIFKVFLKLPQSRGHLRFLVYLIKGKSYVCFDIFGGTERAPSRGHRARMQLPQTFCPLCDKQVIASALKATRAILGKP